MDSWISNFFCCQKNDALEPSNPECLTTSSTKNSLESCSCSTSSSFTVGLSVSENSCTSLPENDFLNLRECTPKPLIKITMLPLSDETMTTQPSLGPKHLHYTSIVYEETPNIFSLSQSSLPNYDDVIISSRPSFSYECCAKKMSLSQESNNTELYNKLQKARYDSSRQLPPLPKSPRRTSYRNTSSYNCKTYL